MTETAFFPSTIRPSTLCLNEETKAAALFILLCSPLLTTTMSHNIVISQSHNLLYIIYLMMEFMQRRAVECDEGQQQSGLVIRPGARRTLLTAEQPEKPHYTRLV